MDPRIELLDTSRRAVKELGETVQRFTSADPNFFRAGRTVG